MQEIKLYNSIGKNLLYLLACSIFVAIGIWMVSSSDETFEFVIGIVGILFFGIGFVVIPFRLFDRRPRIIINDEGIFDRTLDVGTIEWRDIKDAYLQSVHGTEFISLDLRAENKYLQRISKTKAKIASYNKFFGFENINLNLGGVNRPGKEVLEIIKREISKQSKLQKRMPRNASRFRQNFRNQIN